ncbi:MAG: DHH family phosphoesterase [candidate division KSB1 bacterium]|nr:DHH family phosphoesterase [candidate division KSB1 bacterium]MDZ7364382.1 DHH family phosphoesterase [candidate division KSB1 bacterium]MDZ7402754.1 DHH family phosphoesterase [candidate division KSB1 bacterium]
MVENNLAKLDHVLAGCKRLLILTHDYPDPDALASALLLSHLARKRYHLRTRLAHGGLIYRAENRALVQQLHIKLTHVNAIRWKQYRHIALVDTQPDFGNHSLPAEIKPTVVFDHHHANAATPVRFEDIRPNYGATVTILWEYLTAAELEMTADLATAVTYAIRTETQELGRDISPPDVEAYLKAYPKASKKKLAKILNPKLPKSYFLLLQTALQNARVFRHAAHVHLGEVESPELVAQIADLLLRHERLSWALATGRFDNQLFVSMRCNNADAHAGQILQQIVGKMGTAGGHAMTAGGRMPLSQNGHADWQDLENLVIARFLKKLRYAKDIEWKPLLGEENDFQTTTNNHKTGITKNDLTNDETQNI